MSFWKNLLQRLRPEASAPEDWEAVLVQADLGLPLTQKFVAGLERAKLLHDAPAAEAWLRKELLTLLESPPARLVLEKPEVVLLVGVNGSGKTTTAAKLARLFQQRGAKVVLGAADTFRAAAVEQLQTWGERLGIPVVHGASGADPASVAFASYQTAQEQNADWLIVDTAGRQANRHNLMEELAKIKRVLGRRDPLAPHHVWLVADATTGSAALMHAREFGQAASVTGLILTKLDGSAKGGLAAAARAELNLPTLFVGSGEKPEDLQPFDAARYVDAFFNR